MPHVPALRRFARMLLGSQQQGDDLVRATLTALQRKPPVGHADARKCLYRACVDVLRKRAKPAAVLVTEQVTPRLDSVSTDARMALLLERVEQFPTADTAEIMNSDPARVSSLVTQAIEEAEASVRVPVLIIEDDALIAMGLEELLAEHGYEVCGVARTSDEAVALAQVRQPGLLLADVQLAQGTSGIDAVNAIADRLDIPAIFVTAYPELLLTGETAEPTYLISKPYDAATLRVAIFQALFFRDPAWRQRRPAA